MNEFLYLHKYCFYDFHLNNVKKFHSSQGKDGINSQGNIEMKKCTKEDELSFLLNSKNSGNSEEFYFKNDDNRFDFCDAHSGQSFDSYIARIIRNLKDGEVIESFVRYLFN